MSLESISAFATALGTLVLAIATFSATRSANRAARTAEVAVQIGQRPLLMASKLSDERQRISFGDAHWTEVGGAEASVEYVNDVVYFVLSLRNVGTGVAVLQGWLPYADRRHAAQEAPAEAEFRAHFRDLYIPAGDIGLWQGALRDQEQVGRDEYVQSAVQRRPMGLDLLYSDADGGQRTITRFGLLPVDDGRWVGTVVRHWTLDRPSPR